MLTFVVIMGCVLFLPWILFVANKSATAPKVIEHRDFYLDTGMCENLRDYVVLDLETTGLSDLRDEIIEYAAVRYVDGHPIDQIQSLVNPKTEIPPRITQLTGITQSMVDNAPLISESLPQLIDFIGGRMVVAHNAPFDVGFIENSAKRHLDVDLDLLFWDTLPLFRTVFPHLNNYKLGTVANYLGLVDKTHHRALSDTLTTGQCLRYVIDNCTGTADTSLKIFGPEKKQKPREHQYEVALDVNLVNAYTVPIQQNIANAAIGEELKFEYDLVMEKYGVFASSGLIGYLPKGYNDTIRIYKNFEITLASIAPNGKGKAVATVKASYSYVNFC
ncbi:MAG: 3'-5' exonuclease [Candidatus Fimivivens sp.]|nr:3'-5' exonuclease [Candidatus Fimivivens sp.]